MNVSGGINRDLNGRETSGTRPTASQEHDIRKRSTPTNGSEKPAGKRSLLLVAQQLLRAKDKMTRSLNSTFRRKFSRTGM